MKSSELQLGAMYATVTTATKDPMVVVPVDVSLTWHKKIEREERHSYYRSSRPRYRYGDPELYQVTDKSTLEKYSRGGVAVLSMNARLFFRTAGKSQKWVPDVLSPKQFEGPWEDLRLKFVDEDREEMAARRLKELQQEYNRIAAEKEAAQKLATLNLMNGLLDSIVDLGYIPNDWSPDSISFYQNRQMKTQRCLIRDGVIAMPLSFAEPIFRLALQTDLYRRLAGVDKQDLFDLLGIELDTVDAE